MNINGTRPDEALKGYGALFENETSLGKVFYELNISKWIEMGTLGIKETDKYEIGGQISPTSSDINIDSLIGRNLTLQLEDERLLDFSVGVYGSINQNSNFYNK